jgi:hypothetical protein
MHSCSQEGLMRKYPVRLALLALLASAFSCQPSQAKMGLVRVSFTKAGLIAGAGAGRGVLTFEGRQYPFKVSGLSLGVTIGASTSRLVGRASYLHQLSDFAGTYTAVGGGGALVGGIAVVQLKNDNGVIITLQGPKAGMEFAANLSGIRIAFD